MPNGAAIESADRPTRPEKRPKSNIPIPLPQAVL
jgi:hypothetical protein